MTRLDPRTPVIIGAGQLNDRDLDSEPIDLMTRCSEAAIADAGGTAHVRAAIDAVRVVWGIWPYLDPGRLVADRLGRPDARTTLTTTGGNQVYDLVVDTAEQITSGSIDVAVVCAATAQLLARPTPHGDAWRTQVEACIAHCQACVDECGEHEHEHCQACAAACREAVEALRALLDVAD